MIIRLKKADFSENNIGLLDTYSIKVHGTGLASEDLASTVKKDTVLTGTLTLNSGFTTSDIKVTMKGTDITSQCTITASGTTVTITTPAVTGKIEILVGDVDTAISTIEFTNDEFEIGALDGSGNPVDLTTRYRTKAIKKFNQEVLLTGKVLSGEANPAHVRVAQYNNGAFASMGQFADSATIPANTEFRLILERSAGGNVVRGNIVLTVPTGATRLYVNTLKGDKGISYVKTDRETIQGSAFTDGLYHYGTVGQTKSIVTSSSKMAAYESYIPVNAGESVEVNVFTSATLGCVFTDDTDKVIQLGENATFSGRDYQPLDFFDYTVQ